MTANYGEAGAMRRYRPDIPTDGGQNSDWDLAVPPSVTRTAVVVGYPETTLRRWFAAVATIDNGVDLTDDEQDERLWLCSGPTTDWTTLWAHARNLG